ncbi:uncharacterized protein EHS24_004719 [Apiotrichum porosum]|uniref:Uncharacterized protein n=1 Tax=Apiotrichum porosum TaxID=105984 RepID=A0A427Y5U6_9TREE|nr:uncharacterized protein EHS24_004719 [Apiotrichum porosum]RSH86463.1 hypothetical protein EHS24_004719 [Apiotrichum porosum]
MKSFKDKDKDASKDKENVFDDTDSKEAPPPPYSGSRLSKTFSRLSSNEKKTIDKKKPIVEEPPAPPPVDPVTQLPTTFRVGTHYIPPLVTVPELVNHLVFLACLNRLQQDVRECPTPSDSEGKDAPEDKQVPEDVKWGAFCERASHRFQQWATSEPMKALYDQIMTRPAGERYATRPEIQAVLSYADIDVLMAWHTYMLNPGAYEQDMEREGGAEGKLRGLRALGAFPLSWICAQIDPTTYEYRSGTSGRALVALHPTDTTVDIACPKCSHWLQIPLIGVHGKGGGIAMPELEFPCPNCELEVTHPALRFGRFIRDLQDVQSGRIPCLAGLGRYETPPPQQSFTEAVGVEMSKGLVLSAAMAQDNLSYSEVNMKAKVDLVKLGKLFEWSHDRAREDIEGIAVKHRLFDVIKTSAMLGAGSPQTYRRTFAYALSRMNRVYNGGNGGVTSIDLGPAIMRQAGFIASMAELGWLETARWKNEADTARFFFLQKAAARYHAFLDLMYANQYTMLSPTLDIDLAWHSHQLLAARYAKDTRQYVGRFINHDDAVADVTLKHAYDETAALWASRFHTSYSGCGCPVTAKATTALNRAVRRENAPSFLFWKKKQAASTAGTMKGIAAMGAGTASADDRAAECPSTHNRVHVSGSPYLDILYSLSTMGKGAGSTDPAHPDPFTKPLGQQQQQQRKRAPADAYFYDPYWGVAPYTAMGPWGLGNPWALTIGVGAGVAVGVGVGVAAGSGAACSAGVPAGAACCSGVGAACSAAVNGGGLGGISACAANGMAGFTQFASGLGAVVPILLLALEPCSALFSTTPLK